MGRILPVKLVEGLVVNTNGGVIDTRTEVANSLHPLTGLRGCKALIVKFWDAAVGGTPKTFTTINMLWRIGGGVGWSAENPLPHNTAGAFFTNAAEVVGESLRSGMALHITPIVWGATILKGDYLGLDDLAFRIVTDATVNPGTFHATAEVYYGDDSYG